MATKVTPARNSWNCVLYTKSISFIYALIHHTSASLMIWGLIVTLSVFINAPFLSHAPFFARLSQAKRNSSTLIIWPEKELLYLELLKLDGLRLGFGHETGKRCPKAIGSSENPELQLCTHFNPLFRYNPHPDLMK
jgi:hypothetical protein